MPYIGDRKYNGVPGIYIKTPGAESAGEGSGAVRFPSLTSAPNTTGEYLLFVEGGNLKFWNGTTETTVGSGGGNDTLDSAYSAGSAITVDAGAVALAGSHATNNVLEVTLSGTGTGNLIDIQNNGTGVDGKDIIGTDDTWSVSSAGAIDAVSVTGDTMVAGSGAATGVFKSSGNFDVQLITGNATSSDLTIVDGANGDVDITLDGTGKVNINGTTEGNIGLQLTNGDMNIDDGSLIVTDDDNAESVTVINNTATTIGAAASAGVMQVESTSLTTGALINAQLTEGTLNGGFYYSAWDATAAGRVFSVAEDGLTTIAGAAAGTDALVLTVGDIFLSDSDGSVIESEDGTTTLLTVDNKLGVIADNSAVLLVDAGGAVAAGGNALRVILSGTADAGAIAAEIIPDAGSYGLMVNGGGVATHNALHIDADPTAQSVAYVHSDAVIADDKAVLELDHATGASASGSNILRIKESGTTNAGARAFEMDVQVDMLAVYIDSDAATNDSFTLTGQGNLATAKTMFRVVNTGTPAAADSYLSVFDYDGATMTNNADAVLITSAGTGRPLRVTSTGAVAGATVDVESTNAGATGPVLRLAHQGGSQANADVVGRILFMGEDDAQADENYARIDVLADDVAAANPDGSMGFYVAVAGTVTQMMLIDNASVSVGTGAAAGILQSDGNFDVTLQTGNATTSKITITDGANGNIALITDGSGKTVVGSGAAAGTIQSSGEFDLVLETGNATTGNITITDGANGAITLTPNGTGDVVAAADTLMIGDANANATLTTSGTGDLILNTNAGTNSSSVTIADAANGDVTVAINGTGNLNLQNVTYEATSTVTTTTTLTWGGAEGQVIFATSAGGAYSITLPAAATVGAGGWLTFVKTDAAANAITLDGNAAETIDGAATYAAMDAQYDAVTIMCDGDEWFIVSRDIA